MKRAVLISLMFAAVMRIAAADLHVDLNSFPLYVCRGFTPGDLTGTPDTKDSKWVRFDPAPVTGRSVRLMDLGFDELPSSSFFSFESGNTMEFTYYIPFNLNPVQRALLSKDVFPGIHLASIGDNWQIFLNGEKINEAMDLDENGEIRTGYERRDVYFPVIPDLFKEGTNHLVIRILGDPAYPPQGLQAAGPYYIDEYKKIENANSEKLTIMFIGLYLFIGIYHLFIFMVRPQDRYNLFYGLFSTDLALYLFARTHTVYALIESRRAIFDIELSSLFLIIPFLGGFIDWLKHSKILKMTYAYTFFCLALITGVLVMPKPIGYDLLEIWQISGLIMGVYIVIYRIVVLFFVDQFKRWKRQSGEEQSRGLLSIILTGIKGTAVGNIILGAIFLLATGVFDILDAIYFHMDLVLTQYGFFVFTMSTAFILANRFSFLHSRMRDLNLTLEERIEDLTATSQLLSINEKKYRSLFDGTSEPVALLREDFSFIEGNNAAMSMFGLDRPGNERLSLYDVVFGQEIEKKQSRKSLERIRRTLLNVKKPQDIKLRVRTPIGEAKPCILHMEFITSLNQQEILLRVLQEKDDPLLQSFIEGREVYTVESTLSAADDATRRVTQQLKRYMDAEEANFLSICLREVLINAVEHGNLEISFDEKSKAQEEERYFEFLQERQEQEPYNSRTVHIEYSITPKRAIYRITDMGPGFDHKSFISRNKDPQTDVLEHGRGLFMTLNAFDTVKYNDKGNQVMLVKNFEE